MLAAGKIAMAMAQDHCRRALSEYLKFQGYDVRTVASTDSVLQMFHQWSPDLVVCEHRLPGLDLIAVCHALRALSMVPILALLGPESPLRPAQALNAGADTCVSLPCEPDDVLSYVHAALRRVPPRQPEMRLLEVGDFRIVEDTRRCLVAGQEVRLTSQPFSLLLYMLRSDQRVFTHAELAQVLWGSQHLNDPEFLRPVVMNLRKMIEPDWRHPTYLLTEYRIGYRINTCRK